jgi:hypothetical protein
MTAYHSSWDRAIANFQKYIDEQLKPRKGESEDSARAAAEDRAYMEACVRLLSDLKERPEFAELRVGSMYFAVLFSLPSIARFIQVHTSNGGHSYRIWVMPHWEEAAIPGTETTVDGDNIVSELGDYVRRLRAGEF